MIPSTPSLAQQAPTQRSVQELEQLVTNKTKSPQEKLEVLAEEFEQIIFRQMFRSIQKSSFGQGFFAESGGNSQYSEMALQQLSDTLAQSASLGIADSLHTQLMLAHQTKLSQNEPQS